MVMVSPERIVRSMVTTFAEEVAMQPAVAPARTWTKIPAPRYGVCLSGARLKLTTIEYPYWLA
jgi:hypothetical protein